MNETTVRLAHDTRASNRRKDDSYPIKIRLRHKGKNELIAIGKEFSVKISDWNDKKDEVRGSHPNGVELRVKCANYLKNAQKVLDSNVYVLETLTPKQLSGLIKESLKKPNDSIKPMSQKDLMIKLNSNKTLKEWADILINRKRKAKKWGTADWYELSIESILAFNGSETLLLKNLTKSFLEEYIANELGKENKIGTINNRLRALRVILNRAVGEKELSPEYNPFHSSRTEEERVKIPNDRNRKKRAVDPEIISAFKEARNTKKVNSSDWHVINETIIMWELLGMNFVDLVKLKVEQVQGDRIDYHRSKTNQAISVKNRDLVKEIVEYYANGKESDDFVFRYGYEDSEAGYKRYKQQRKRYNRRAKDIAHELGYEEVDFTSYAIRHTFATTLYLNGISKGQIGEMFGHREGSSIDTYIDKTDADILDSAADTVLGKY